MPRKDILKLLNEEVELGKIRDFHALLGVYGEYLQGHFFLMSKGIKRYDEFEFFRDLLIYLRHHYQNESYKHEVYENVMEIYFKVDDLFNNYFNN